MSSPINSDTRSRTGEVSKRERKSPSRATRDADATKNSILNAAVAEFARSGLGGTRVDDISTRAQCNLRMLYYYFGNKENLYVAALEKVYEDFVSAERLLDIDSLEPCEGVRHMISFTWHYFQEHPEFISLLNTENMLQASFAKQSTRISSNASPQLHVLEKLLLRGIEEGAFRRDASVFETHLTIISLCYFYLSNQATMSNYLGRDMMNQGARDSWLSPVCRVVLDSLVAR